MNINRRYWAYNDTVIEDLLSDPKYDVHADGTIWRQSKGVWKQTGNAKTCKRGKYYRHLMYRGSNILVHRIIYRKFHGELDSSLIVNHIDGESLNNIPSNLELITQHENIIHAHHSPAKNP